MSDGEPLGIRYDGTEPDKIDSWSQMVFDALSDWPIAQAGSWTRWDPGYLLLEITTVGDEEIEPIYIDSHEGQVTVMLGYWEDSFPFPETGTQEENAVVAAAQAERLVEQWLGGEFRTAVYYQASGEWCGSVVIEGVDIEAQLRHAASSLRDFAPNRVELRTPARKDWEEIAIPPEWLAAPTPPPSRLPG